jgi:Trk K+ transport system NAD-binding subunit
MRKKMVKSKILLKENWIWFLIVIGWFIVNYIVFYMLNSGNYNQALLYTFFFAQMPGLYGNFYQVMSDFVIFGLLIGLVTVGLYRNYHPEQTSLAISRSMKNHTIIVGFSHLGQRIRAYLIKNNKQCVVIEDDKTLVKGLIEDEEPIIVQKPLKAEVLEQANVKQAKLVIFTQDDLEILAVGTNLIRDVNKTCKIVCRCFDDSLAQILERQVGCKVISTSFYAADLIIGEVEKIKAKNLLIIGCTHTARRLLQKMKDRNISYKIIDYNRATVEDLLDEEPIIVGDAKDKDILKEAGISSIDLAIILTDTVSEILLIADQVRELNKNCALICRFFHEEVAEILEKPPFNAFVTSTSQHMVEKLIEMGIFAHL